MATAPALITEEAGTDLVPATAIAGTIVLVDQTQYAEFLKGWKDRADGISKDASTKKGRQEMQSFETDLRKKKADINRDRLALTAEMRSTIAAVNDQGSAIADTLEKLIDDTCGPLTEWKAAEKARIAECEAAIAFLKNAAVILADDTLDTILTRGANVKATVIDAERYGSLYEPAMDAKKAAFFALKEAHGRLTKEAEERAEAKRVADELADMKREKEEREQREADERQREQEASDALKRQSDYASAIIRHIRECREARIDGKTYAWAICLNDVENRIETGDEAIRAFGDRAGEVEREAGEASVYIREQIAADAERHRKEVAEQAAKDARDQADREREDERLKEQADAQAKIDEANARARALEEAEEQRKADEAAELQRIADQEAEEAAERRRLADDRRHQIALNVEAIRVITTFGISKEAAGSLVDAVRDGDVPHFAWEA